MNFCVFMQKVKKKWIYREFGMKRGKMRKAKEVGALNHLKTIVLALSRYLRPHFGSWGSNRGGYTTFECAYALT